MRKYALLDYGDRKRELKSAMSHRLSKTIYVMEVFRTKTAAIEKRDKTPINKIHGYRHPIGRLDDAEQLPSAYWKGTLLAVEY